MTSPENTDNAPQAKEFEFTNAPNLLTLSRILVIPAIIFLLFLHSPLGDLFAAILFTLAGITDYFDGYLARKLKIETVYGKLMDPLADKFLVVSCLCMLQQLGRIHVVVVILLICREMGITGLRALASSEGLIISASSSAKWKTATQMVAIGFLIVRDGLFGVPLYHAGEVLLYLSLALSLGSAASYVFDFFKAIQRKRKQKRALKRALKAQRMIAKKLMANERFFERKS